MKKVIGILLLFLAYKHLQKRQLPPTGGGGTVPEPESGTTNNFQEAEVLEEITVKMV